jgi:hypothetical protein
MRKEFWAEPAGEEIIRVCSLGCFGGRGLSLGVFIVRRARDTPRRARRRMTSLAGVDR